jgi:hypothetical protein
MNTRNILLGLATLWAVMTVELATAQPDVPDALEPWRAWVLHGEEYRSCPLLSGRMPGDRAAHVCAWPGALVLDADVDGAAFRQRWRVAAEDWVPLPGDSQTWPAAVTLDGEPVAVVERDGRPAIRVAAGNVTVSGALRWSERPAFIAIPVQTGIVELTLNGQPVARPDIERGTLWLGREAQAAVEEDRLTVSVYRLLADGLPVRAITEIQLDVAGSSREVALDGALLAGFVAEALESVLPAQLDGSGTLRVQVRPGNWSLRVSSHAATLPETITVAQPAAPWPGEEIWSYAADTRLRIAVLEGAEPIDSAASEVPLDWRSYPSYRVVGGATLNLVERSRNDADEPSRYSLDRQLWLDFSGDGFTALDTITGSVSSGWRLDMAAPYTMTMATLDLTEPGGENNLLITTRGEPGVQGVEIRDTTLDLATTARVEYRGATPVTGYLDAFDNVRTTLHLPPGRRLLAAPGADGVTGAWLNSWRLLDLFLALIVATAAWRLLGIRAGIVAGLAMVLVMHEPFAPRWIWLNALVAIALLRVAPEGRLRHATRLYRNASIAALTLLLLPFTVTQLSTAIYPQLERPSLQRGLTDGRAAGGVGFGVADEAMVMESSVMSAAPAALEEAVVRARRVEEELPRFLPGTLLQTGPGLPDWSWTRATLRWTSPVDANQTYRLVILNRWATALWRIVSVAAAIGLLLLLARPVLRLPGNLLRGGAAALAVTVIALLALPQPAHAQTLTEFPTPALLEELKARLTEPAPCHPACAELTRATASIAGESLTVDLEFANQAPVAVPLPGDLRGWHATAIAIDGAPTNEVYVDVDGRYWLSLSAGVHTVRVAGALPMATSVTIPFPQIPRSVTTDTPGWDVTGLTDGRLLSGALELVREQPGAEDDALGASEFRPYVRITRSLEMGLEWQVRTTVERVAPRDTAFSIELPLLENEAVLTADIEVAEGLATAAFAAGQNRIGWTSRLPDVTSLSLTASANMPWSERWLISIGPLWHAEIAGIPRTPAANGGYAFDYSPRPGETLTLDLSQPEPAAGDTIAIDSVSYDADVGQRLTRATLQFEYRSTRAEQHVVTLPEQAELDSVTMDGEPLALRLDGRALELPVTTGEHNVRIAWRIARNIGLTTTIDPVDLGAGASNLSAGLTLPPDRWVLSSFGPTLGSAVLYWSELVVFALAAIALGRLQLSPLRTHEWLLLGLGLSTFAWPTLLLFALWAFAMSWRATTKAALADRAFNATQFGLGLLSFVALVSLIAAIPTGLLGTPDMHIVSPVGDGRLTWFADRTAGVTPGAGVVSVSLWFYRAAMLAWALWLSFALLRWLPWAWRAYSRDGLWRGRIARTAKG